MSKHHILPERFEVRAGQLAVGGDAVARVDGKVVFVSNALPGERVDVELQTEKKTFAKATVVDVLEAADTRIPDGCEHSTDDGCGGCGLRFIAPSDALPLKVEAVMGELEKIGRNVEWPDPTVIPTGPSDEHRIRLRLHVDRRSGKVGLYKQGSHDVVEIPRCRVARPHLLDALTTVAAVVSAMRRHAPHELILECDDAGARLHWPGELGSDWLERLLENDTILGVRTDSVVAGDPWLKEEVTVGDTPLSYERLCGTFGQANPTGSQILRETVHTWLADLQPESVTDLFAGAGNFTLVAAGIAQRVLAVEQDPAALESLAKSVIINQLEGVETLEKDLREELGNIKLGDVTLLDPPRSGAAEIAEVLQQRGPDNVLYIACGPTTFARDVANMPRYRVQELVALDMFPSTPHLELAAWLTAT